MQSISSRDNPKLRSLRRLAESRGQRRIAKHVAELIGRPLEATEDLLLLEGPHLIDAGLGSGAEFRQVFVASAPSPAVAAAAARLEALPRSPDRFEVDGDLLHTAVEAESSQGICALAVSVRRPLESTTLQGRVAAVWLDRLRDPGNVGAVLRVAEAAGVPIAAMSPNSASWRHPRALRASAGSALRLVLRTGSDFADFRQQLDRTLATQVRWIGLSARGESLEGAIGSSEAPLGIALGSETHGIDPEVERRCDALGALEMAEPVESLNVAVAAGIALYLLRRNSDRG